MAIRQGLSLTEEVRVLHFLKKIN